MYGLKKATPSAVKPPPPPPKHRDIQTKDEPVVLKEKKDIPILNQKKEKISNVPSITRIKQTCGLFNAFNSDSTLVDLILRVLGAEELLQLRITCHDFYDIVLLYLQRILRNIPFTEYRGGTDMDFFQPHPIDRIEYLSTRGALYNNRLQGFPVSRDQMTARCIVSLDSLSPPLIQICDHVLPQRHTCRSVKKYNVSTNAFSDLISIIDFLKEYRQRAKHIQQEELLWVGQPNGAFLSGRANGGFATLLLETLLKGLQAIANSRLGKLSFQRTEMLANGSFFLRHRIWIQAVLSWGWEDPRPCVQRRQQKKLLEKDAALKKKVPKTWTVRLPPGTSKQSTEKISATTEKKKELKKEQQSMQNIPKDKITSLSVTIADHFSWDS